MEERIDFKLKNKSPLEMVDVVLTLPKSLHSYQNIYVQSSLREDTQKLFDEEIEKINPNENHILKTHIMKCATMGHNPTYSLRVYFQKKTEDEKELERICWWIDSLEDI